MKPVKVSPSLVDPAPLPPRAPALQVPGRGALTPGGQAGAAAPVLARAALAGVGVEHAAQLQLGQAHHLSEAAALVLQRELLAVQHHRVQAALEAAQHLRDPRVGQAADAIRLHQRPEVDGALCAQRLEVEGRPAPLHVAVVQGQAGEIAVELQEDRVPAPIVDGAARDAQDPRAIAAVQLEPQLAIHDLCGERAPGRFSACVWQYMPDTLFPPQQREASRMDLLLSQSSAWCGLISPHYVPCKRVPEMSQIL